MTFTEFFFNHWSDYCLVDASFIGVFMVWKQISLVFDTREHSRQPPEFMGRFRKHTKTRYRNEVLGFSTAVTLVLLGVMDFQYQIMNPSPATIETAQAPVPVQQPIPNGMNANTDNLIANGDFDNVGNVFVENAGWSDNLPLPGGTNIPDWDNVAPLGAPPGYAEEAWIEPVNGYGNSASPDNGSGYLVDLTGYTDEKPYGGIGQTIQTLPGHRYKLTFDFGASIQKGPAAMFVNVIGATQLASKHLVLEPTVSMQWEKETVLFMADSDTTMIEFIGDSNYTSQFIGLDNVGVFAAGTE